MCMGWEGVDFHCWKRVELRLKFGVRKSMAIAVLVVREGQRLWAPSLKLTMSATIVQWMVATPRLNAWYLSRCVRCAKRTTDLPHVWYTEEMYVHYTCEAKATGFSRHLQRRMGFCVELHGVRVFCLARLVWTFCVFILFSFFQSGTCETSDINCRVDLSSWNSEWFFWWPDSRNIIILFIFDRNKILWVADCSFVLKGNKNGERTRSKWTGKLCSDKHWRNGGCSNFKCSNPGCSNKARQGNVYIHGSWIHSRICAFPTERRQLLHRYVWHCEISLQMRENIWHLLGKWHPEYISSKMQNGHLGAGFLRIVAAETVARLLVDPHEFCAKRFKIFFSSNTPAEVTDSTLPPCPFFYMPLHPSESAPLLLHSLWPHTHSPLPPNFRNPQPHMDRNIHTSVRSHHHTWPYLCPLKIAPAGCGFPCLTPSRFPPTWLLHVPPSHPPHPSCSMSTGCVSWQSTQGPTLSCPAHSTHPVSIYSRFPSPLHSWSWALVEADYELVDARSLCPFPSPSLHCPSSPPHTPPVSPPSIFPPHHSMSTCRSRLWVGWWEVRISLPCRGASSHVGQTYNRDRTVT